MTEKKYIVIIAAIICGKTRMKIFFTQHQRFEFVKGQTDSLMVSGTRVRKEQVKGLIFPDTCVLSYKQIFPAKFELV